MDSTPFLNVTLTELGHFRFVKPPDSPNYLDTGIHVPAKRFLKELHKLMPLSEVDTAATVADLEAIIAKAENRKKELLRPKANFKLGDFISSNNTFEDCFLVGQRPDKTFSFVRLGYPYPGSSAPPGEILNYSFKTIEEFSQTWPQYKPVTISEDRKTVRKIVS